MKPARRSPPRGGRRRGACPLTGTLSTRAAGSSRAKADKDILFWLLAACAAVLVGLFGLVLAGVIPLEARSEAQTLAPAVATIHRCPTAASARRDDDRRACARAARGRDCHRHARQLLARGAGRLGDRQHARGGAHAPRGRVGDSGNVNVTVNGQPRRLPFGTVAVVLRPKL